RSKGAVYDALGAALEKVTLKDIIGWFQLAGLCATHVETALAICRVIVFEGILAHDLLNSV
ncbi:MAG: hypothetical protein ACP5XB_25805, partial [Isosphaeraceae bacterium]